MSDIWQKLKAPFPADKVSWRVGSTNRDKTKGMALAYIDARDVMERLDEAIGPQFWQCRYPHANGKTVCEIGILCAPPMVFMDQAPEHSHWTGWVWKSDGAGDSDVEAEKGALSDAFKRAAVRWGIGRYLYDLASPWVEIEQYGKSYRIKDSEYTKLRRLLDKDAQDHAPRQSAPAKEPIDPAESHNLCEFLLESANKFCTAYAKCVTWNNENADTIKTKLNARDQDRIRDAMSVKMHAFKEAEKDAA